jgi:hypothetical protein
MAMKGSLLRSRMSFMFAKPDGGVKKKQPIIPWAAPPHKRIACPRSGFCWTFCLILFKMRQSSPFTRRHYV